MLLEGVVAHANEVIDPHEARATQRRFILLSIPMRGNEFSAANGITEAKKKCSLPMRGNELQDEEVPVLVVDRYRSP